MHNDSKNVPFQRVRRNLARASNALSKGDYSKAIQTAKTAFSLVPACRGIYGQQKIELKFMLEEFCDKFSSSPGILLILEKMRMRAKPYIKFTNNNHQLIVNRLEILGTRMEDLESEKERKSEAKRQRRKREFLRQADEYLKAGEMPRGKSYLRRVAEEFGDEAGVITLVGQKMFEAELYLEAAEILEESRRKFPQDDTAYQFCVQSYIALQEFAKAESVYKDALRQFGNHPVTLLNLSKLYLTWRKRDEAYEFARRALEADPSLTEAREIMEKTA